jgi:trans-aconitate 2-methyltransferase
MAGVDSPDYAFGRDGIAATRLGMLHRIFSPAGLELVADACGGRRLDVAIDLGCGPGYTTRMLGEALRPARLIGLDLGQEFLGIARRDVLGAAFVEHDLYQVPLPGAPADLLYARYVLSHLRDVPERLGDWASQLRPGGLLLVEENDWLEAREPVFKRYLELATEVMASGGGDMYIGSRLEASLDGLPLRPVVSRVREVSPSSAAVARMFRLNLLSWGDHPAARPYAAEVNDIRQALDHLCDSPDEGRITWGLRQLAAERAG